MTADSTVRVRFVNHACISVETPRFSLLTDPWFSGSVFNDSWRLIRETDSATLDLSVLHYLWVSHEHPDHFHYPTLRTIRSKVTGPLTVFFQDIPDKAVRDSLLKLGYSVVELADGVPREIEPGLVVTCFRAIGGDSVLLVDAGGTLIADTNDCGLTDRHLARIRAACGGRPLDVLLTQFGLAGYYANVDDDAGLRGPGTSTSTSSGDTPRPSRQSRRALRQLRRVRSAVQPAPQHCAGPAPGSSLHALARWRVPGSPTRR